MTRPHREPQPLVGVIRSPFSHGNRLERAEAGDCPAKLVRAPASHAELKAALEEFRSRGVDVIGLPSSPWRRCTDLRLRSWPDGAELTHSGSGPKDQRYLMLATTLERLPMGARTFGRRPGPGIGIAVIDWPRRWLMAALPLLVFGVFQSGSLATAAIACASRWSRWMRTAASSSTARHFPPNLPARPRPAAAVRGPLSRDGAGLIDACALQRTALG